MILNILIADDSAVMRKIIIKAIKSGRFKNSRISEVCDGVEGLKLFEPGKFELLLIDWHMPNLNGVEFIRKIKQINTHQRVTIIMVTTEGSAAKMEEALNAGADNYIIKPFTSKQLEQKLMKYFPLR